MGRKTRGLIGLVAVSALALAACGGDGNGTDTPGGGQGTGTDNGGNGGAEQITLSVATFNEFGYEELFEQYMTENPGIVIEHRKAATMDDARQNLITGMAAGAGLADIEAAEVAWFAEVLQYADQFVDLNDPELEGRWLDWKVEAATTPDGKLVGYGTDIGPEAVCYRADLFEQAGLPSDREEVAALLEGGWDTYFEVGQGFTEATGIPWYDGAIGTYNGMVQQLSDPYEIDGEPIPLEDNTDVRAIYDDLVANQEISAGLGQWSEDWTAAFQSDGFATMLCPPWMTGVIAGNAEGVEGWDIANVFPGGGGNWGGSYLLVPEQGQHHEEARALAAWLTAPEQQVVAFQAVGAFPSTIDALQSEELLAHEAEFFNNAPSGEIFSDRAQAIDVQPTYGPNFFIINTIVADAITRWDVEGSDPDSSWEQALRDYQEAGI